MLITGRSWRQPALSIHNVSVDGPSKTLIPSAASASISLRIVPDQSLEAIIEQLKSYLTKSFSTLRTFNTLSVCSLPLLILVTPSR